MGSSANPTVVDCRLGKQEEVTLAARRALCHGITRRSMSSTAANRSTPIRDRMISAAYSIGVSTLPLASKMM